MLRATSISDDTTIVPFDIVVLGHEERHIRRKVLTLQHGDEVLVDLPRAVVLDHGSRLVLEDGRHVEVIAGEEELIEVRAGAGAALPELAWHLGNRHHPVQIETERLLAARDHVIEDMLIGLGATVTRVSEPFQPVRAAYHAHGHGHAHGDAHGRGHGHG